MVQILIGFIENVLSQILFESKALGLILTWASTSFISCVLYPQKNLKEYKPNNNYCNQCTNVCLPSVI